MLINIELNYESRSLIIIDIFWYYMYNIYLNLQVKRMLCVVIIAMVDYENGNQVKLLEIFKIILFFSYFIKLFISKFDFFIILQGIKMEVYLFYFGILNVVFCVSYLVQLE